MAVVYFSSDGLGKDVHGVQPALIRWIRSQNNADLIVYGGDVYNDGTPEEFQLMLADMGGDVSKVCHTPGNHCWRTMQTGAGGRRFPSSYEAFWKQFPQDKGKAIALLGSSMRFQRFMGIGIALLILTGIGMMILTQGVFGQMIWFRIKFAIVQGYQSVILFNPAAPADR